MGINFKDMKNIINLSAVVLLLSFMASCSKEDNEPFLKRDTDNLTFQYTESTASFTVRTNGAWSLDLSEADWITADQTEGVGDGEKAQTVTVTAKRNVGEARQGVIKIIASSKQAAINISQAEGKVVFGTPYFTNALAPGFELEDVNLVIPYSKGGLSESAAVNVQVSGTGAPGIQVSNIEAEMSSENGEIKIPLTGTPTTAGPVTLKVQLLGQELTVNTSVKEQGNADPVGTIYLAQDFDLLVLGGDHVGGKAGIHLVGAWPTVDGKRVLPENPTFEASGTRNTDGTGDYFATMHPSFVAARGLAGWTGSRVYERPGYVKIGTTASTDGFIATPKLTAISGWADVKVKFTAARWSENASADKDATVTVRILNAGTSDEADQEITLSPSWEDKEIVVEKATAETVIQFRARNASNGRFMINNIEISKVVK